jgi:HSP20 family protein
MSMERYEPFREMVTLRDAMDRLMQEAFVQPFNAITGRVTLPVDLVERDNVYTMTASVPGFKPEEVQIQIDGSTVTIRAEHKVETPAGEGKPGQFLIHERKYETIYRSITLPNPIEADRVSAVFENGVLTLTLPRAESSKPRTIPIKTTGQVAHG